MTDPGSTPEPPGPTPTGALPPQDAVIFDMDGVVTDTAAVHAQAWQQLFDAVLTDQRASRATGTAPRPFDPDADYRRHVDGRSREDGVAAVLADRGIDVPAGTPQDPPGAWTVHGLAAPKNEIYQALLAEHGVRGFVGTVQLLHRLRAGGVPIALVTASRNAEALLAAANLAGAFDVVVDGESAANAGLPGKPDPAMFLEAARRLAVTPARAAVVEDAAAGVQAARRGGFGLVVGVDRSGHREALEAAGADLVVEDLSQLDLGALRADPWLLVYEGFDPAHEGHREALTALGNGYLGTRGAAPNAPPTGCNTRAPTWPGCTTGSPRPCTVGRCRTNTWSTPRTGCAWTFAPTPGTGGPKAGWRCPRNAGSWICAAGCSPAAACSPTPRAGGCG